jgi:hypothetical protein
MRLCACGCGEDSGVYADSHPERGYLKGQPRKFKHGHNAHVITHGMARHNHPTPEYRAYQAAKDRCTNPKNIGWKNYGGRGIKFLFTSFEQFFAELGLRPKGKSLDRKNNNGHYKPGNVRWATKKEQQKNKRPDSRYVLTMKLARLLRKQASTGKYRLFELAKMHSIKRETIAAALKGKTWKEEDPGDMSQVVEPTQRPPQLPMEEI